MSRCIPLAVLLAMLAGCGFHLRGTGSEVFALDRLHVDVQDRYSELSREIHRQLRQSSVDATAAGAAPASLVIVEERRQRRPVSFSGSGSSARYELELDVTFVIEDQDGAPIGEATTLSSRRIYSFDRSSLVGNSEEEEVLMTEMRRDIAGRILRRTDAALRNTGKNPS